jgi:hypothetical protein
MFSVGAGVPKSRREPKNGPDPEFSVGAGVRKSRREPKNGPDPEQTGPPPGGASLEIAGSSAIMAPMPGFYL